MKRFLLEIHLQGHLVPLVRHQCERGVVYYHVERRASLKDILESIGLPHPEIGRIAYQGRGLSFQFIPTEEMKIELSPFTAATLSGLPNELWPKMYDEPIFLVDINALKAARNLRMVGLDTEIVPDLPSIEIGRYAAEKQRILVTRDSDLLKCRTVLFGQLLRSENHLQQVKEVVERYNLKNLLQPFRRCVSCNCILKDISKDQIEHLLEPLTSKYYDFFKRCTGCKEIYWKGSHHKQMKKRLSELGMLK